ncbi:hypothetical protein ABI59_04715 [Acidobacteria bacterium Mor1]|nr:hypothetical protein ABI59_04715 [Acidobacteria bacterium Mor1]
MSKPLKIMISAGEASGDRLGAGLARSLRAQHPDIELIGMGGEEMEAAGVKIVQQASEVAVVGITEVLAHLPAIRRAMGRLEDILKTEKPDLLVPVDFPDFNLRLTARAHDAGVPVVYFVSPQIWAWRRSRVKLMRRLVKRVLVLFPFESSFYESEGVPVTFVGHPGVEGLTETPERAPLIQGAGLDPERPVVALLPGSRVGEVDRLLEPLLGAAGIVQQRRPGTQFLLQRANTLPADFLDARVAAAGLTDAVIHTGHYPEILTACDAGAVASGTASLESALAGLPMVVVYRMKAMSYFIGRMLVKVPHIAMPNLIAERRVVPELIQGECTPEAIAEELAGYLEDPGRIARVREELAEVRRRLGDPGAFERAAAAVLGEA